MIGRCGLACALALTLTLGGCGSDGGGPVTVARICGPDGPYVKLLEKLFACNPIFGALFLGRAPTTEEITAACESGIQPYVDDGTVVINAAGDMAGCTAFIDDATCDSFRGDVFAGCDSLLDGTIALGGDCEDDAQCLGDAWCDQSGPGCGICAARKADGEVCDVDSQCIVRNCSSFGQCAALGALGDPCNATDDCASGFICDGNVSQCVTEPVWTVGTVCTTDSDCDFGQSNLYCDQGANACTAFLELGDPCSPAGTGGLCRVFEYQSCQMNTATGNNECTAPTIVGDGDTCGVIDGRQCMPGLICSAPFGGGASQCYNPPGVGQACDPAGPACDVFLTCSSVTSTCEYGTYTGMCPAP